MSIIYEQWCRIEGGIIPNKEKEYGELINIPSNVNIFYGNPEIQIYNPNSPINGVVYKVVPISAFGASSINEIDANYASIMSKIANYDRNVIIDDSENSANYYYEPFVVNESSVIFFTDSINNRFNNHIILYVDEFATPDIITFVGSYTGAPVPVGEKFEDKYLEMYVVYSDGNKALVKQGYTLTPEDKIITKVGSNVITVTYTTPTNVTFQATIIIPGIKNIIGISATYDGPSLSFGQEANRRHFIVVAEYSDDSSSTVTDFTFPYGTIISEVNNGVITIYYKGYTTTVTIPTYDISTSRLIAYYNGPNIEVGNNFNIEYCNIKIYYQSSDTHNSYYEDINPSSCTYSTTTIEFEGVNYITVQYEGKLGLVSTKMAIVGIKPEVILKFITAEYTGPDIVINKTFSLERIICKAHYSDGSIVSVKNFSITSNVVTVVGVNEFLITFKDDDVIATTTCSVMGIEADSTTQNNINLIPIVKKYPEITYFNNRYRGPAESKKHTDTNSMLVSNINMLFEIFSSIEKEYNLLVNLINDENSVKSLTLNSVERINNNVYKWINDKRFVSGAYKEDTASE